MKAADKLTDKTLAQQIYTEVRIPFAVYTGSGRCDVCLHSLSGVKAYTVPNNVFYSSQKYRAYMKNMLAAFGQNDYMAHLAQMQANDHSPGSAVCEKCIDMFI